MRRWSDSPVVSFARDGQVFELGRSGQDPVLHLHGSTGLGVAPVDIAKTDRIAGDGSVVRGVRYTDREVYIPLAVEAESAAALSEVRRTLNRLLAPHLGPVEVRIQDPATGTDRMIRGYYTDGLSGDFGDSFHGTWQTLGLTFTCPDPWWLGLEQTTEFAVNPGTKPFLSATVPFFPVVLAQSTVQGRFEVDIRGDGEVFPVWEVIGPGTDLVISDGVSELRINGDFRAGSVTRIDTRTKRIVPDRWTDVPPSSRLFSLTPGRAVLTVTMVGATEDTKVRLTYREQFLEGI